MNTEISRAEAVGVSEFLVVLGRNIFRELQGGSALV